MNLKQRFLKQSILTLIITIIITGCVGFVYDYFYNLLNKSSVYVGLGKTSTVVIENDNIIYNDEEFSSLQIKEMMMNISVESNYYEHDNTKFILDTETFTTVSGD